MSEKRMPSYEESLKTIKRSIQARGGIAEETKVIETLVYNYYKHLPWKERKKLGLIHPQAWDTSQWIEFKRQLLKEKSLVDLVKQAKDHLWYTTNVVGLFNVCHILNKDNRETKMLVLPDTKITIGA